TITLGTDTAQWPLMITLLAGNVVRDESQDVLAGLPEPDLPRPPDATPDPVPDVPDVIDVPEPPRTAPTDDTPRDATRGGVNRPALPGERGRESPLLIDASEHSFLGLGLVPVLSTDLTHIGRVQHFLSLNLLVGVSGGSSGLALS